MDNLYTKVKLYLDDNSKNIDNKLKNPYGDSLNFYSYGSST